MSLPSHAWLLGVLLCPAFLQPVAAPAATEGKITLKKGPEKIDVLTDGGLFTSFYYNTTWPKPFLHPLHSPSGVVVTRGYPIEKIPGESTDHAWHRGLLFGHGDISGFDYWREPVEGKKWPLPLGRIAFRNLKWLKEGGPEAAIAAGFDLWTPENKSIGTLVQVYTFRRLSGCNVVDAEITARADKGQALKFGDTEEGTFALRVADELREDKGATLMNSHGKVGSKEIWGKPAPWVDYSSTVRVEKVGVAIFDHPKNPKYPTHWHARGYGLFAANRFGESDFYSDKKRDGSLTVPDGGEVVFRYRVLIHQGDAQSAGIAELYRQYAGGK